MLYMGKPHDVALFTLLAIPVNYMFAINEYGSLGTRDCGGLMNKRLTIRDIWLLFTFEDG